MLITIVITGGGSALAARRSTVTIEHGATATVEVTFTRSALVKVSETPNIEVQSPDGSTLTNTVVEVEGDVSRATGEAGARGPRLRRERTAEPASSRGESACPIGAFRVAARHATLRPPW